MSEITLGYWNCRGRGEFIRMLLHYSGVEFHDKQYTLGATIAEIRQKSEWAKEKFHLGLDFPNLPYLIDGDVKLTQCIAILRYLGRKYNLCASNEQEAIRIDLIEQECSDLRNKFQSDVIYCGNGRESVKEEFYKSVPDKLQQFSKFLGTRPFVAGDRLTYVDFWFYDNLDFLRVVEEKILDKYENLMAYMKRFESIPAIKNYMTSPRFIRTPLGAPMATFGGK